MLALTLALDAQTTRPAPPASRATPGAPAAKAERAVPFRAGEVLTYDVSWSSYLTAGIVTLSVREKKASYGSTAYYMVAEGRPTPLLSKLYTLYYKADSLLDAYSLLPQRGSVFSDEGGRRRTKTTSFNQGARAATYELQTATLVKKPVTLAPFTQDALSVIYVLRAIPLKPGGSVSIPVTDSGKMYKVQVRVGNVEPVKTGDRDGQRVPHHAHRHRHARQAREHPWPGDLDFRRCPAAARAHAGRGRCRQLQPHPARRPVREPEGAVASSRAARRRRRVSVPAVGTCIRVDAVPITPASTDTRRR